MVKYVFLALGLTVLIAISGDGWTKDNPIPLPRLKPEALKRVEPEIQDQKQAASLAFPKAGLFSGWSKDQIAAERLECATRMKGLDVRFVAEAPIGTSNGCGAAAPLTVDRIAGVALNPPGQFTCDMVEALHAWVGSSLLPAARQNLKKELVRINNASAYVCRRRNNSRSGKLSEHAKANALDIATLAFSDGSTTSIKGDWSGLKQIVGLSAQGKFLRQIRRDACIRFTTVLGPGSDPFHGDHFHVDVARRKSGFRICK
jgi:hypothetical protein